MGQIVNQSNDAAVALTDPGMCGVAKVGAYFDRCGYGPLQPLLVISPFARQNFVDHGVSDQSSTLRLIEDNWSLGRIGDQSADAQAGSLLSLFDFSGNGEGQGNSLLILDPSTGQPVSGPGNENSEDRGGNQ